MAKTIMIQGTTSSAGKSLLVTALCRIFYEDGCKTAPFKSQNMALNSFITDEALEMGRAQVVQAEACCVQPKTTMNPILLKPTTDKKSQVIIEGRVFKNMDAAEYHEYKKELKDIILRNFNKLSESFDVVVLEGAGSPAEINLRENDIVNMGMAEMADSPVIIVADIDRGGVFASLVGTIFLLSNEEKKRVKGVVINKFRGDIKLLEPGLKQLEEIIKIPVLGVIPYLDVKIEDEDSVTEKFKRKNENKKIKVAVIKLPRISNFTDFDAFTLYDDVSLQYAIDKDELNDADFIIIPGTKNTIDDLIWLKEKGLAERIIELHQKNIPIVGICGGYQMLGKSIEDPHGIESSVPQINGLDIIDMTTIMEKEKVTVQTEGELFNTCGILKNMDGIKIAGYEIHIGQSICVKKHEFIKSKKNNGSYLKDGVFGTYIHGIFDNAEFTKRFLNNIRTSRGLENFNGNVDYQQFKMTQYKKLANEVRKALDMDKIYRILNN